MSVIKAPPGARARFYTHVSAGYRAAKGAEYGFWVSVALCTVWTAGRFALDWAPYGNLNIVVLFGLRYLFPLAISSIVVGALYGAMFPIVYRLPGALALTSGTLATLVALVQLILSGGHPNPLFGASVCVAALGGIPLGVMSRDMALYFAPDLQPLERRTSSFAWQFVTWLQRVPFLGGSVRRRRRARLARKPFPESWLAALNTHVPVYRRLPAADQEELRKQVMLFLAEKNIEGRGLLVSDAVRVTIAAQACLLTLRLPDVGDVDPYSRLRTILVYPKTFVPKRPGLTPGGFEGEHLGPLLGESWQAGVVVLSWKAVREGAADPDDGDNVALHEFAHQLDQENGSAEGVPILEWYMNAEEWSRILHEHLDRLKAEEESGTPTVLSYYGATNEAEFFAVATEAFFERSSELQAERPDLYEQLKLFYRQDPSEYTGLASAVRP